MPRSDLVFSSQAWEDYLYWQEHDPRTLSRINRLIRETLRDPHRGIGKPEALRHELAGYWSRRIDAEHRFVYKMTERGLHVVQLRYHYED